MSATMPKEHIPSTGKDVPQPIEDEDYIADRVEEDHSSEDEEKKKLKEGGLGPPG
jgi:hypothetical protein